MSHFPPLVYIDPSSGTILLQAALAGILGVIWRITSLFRRRRNAEESGTAQQTASQPAAVAPSETPE
jgi:hypothetical protein